MKVYKTKEGIVIENQGQFYKGPDTDWDNFINRKGLYKILTEEIVNLEPLDGVESVKNTLAPIGNQEIWASGVTYKRSREARMEESKKAGGGTFYDRVYDADRPELFFKATARRVVGDKGKVRIRKDSDLGCSRA